MLWGYSVRVVDRIFFLLVFLNVFQRFQKGFLGFGIRLSRYDLWSLVDETEAMQQVGHTSLAIANAESFLNVGRNGFGCKIKGRLEVFDQSLLLFFIEPGFTTANGSGYQTRQAIFLITLVVVANGIVVDQQGFGNGLRCPPTNQ